MKIPENPYYGNEENTQWQPNGVIIDSGVGGGVVGSGDAGARPVYPVHIPRHIPAGYVMGAYYPPYPAPPPIPDNFEDYMWMENEEEFDKQVMQQLEEEALMEQCIEAMLEDEQRERHRTVSNGHCATTSTGSCNLSLEETVSRSTLNPLAAEFVPNRVSQTNVQLEEKQENQDIRTDDKKEESVPEVKAVAESTAEDLEEPKPPQPADEPPETPPEVTEPKKKPEVKSKTKQASKSDTKVGLKKTVKSESRTEEKIADVKPATEETGFKPINYAAAAKANKPKKPEQDKPKSDKPAEKLKSDKPAKPADKDKKPLKEKPKVKPEKPVQRKNSTK